MCGVEGTLSWYYKNDKMPIQRLRVINMTYDIIFITRYDIFYRFVARHWKNRLMEDNYGVLHFSVLKLRVWFKVNVALGKTRQ